MSKNSFSAVNMGYKEVYVLSLPSSLSLSLSLSLVDVVYIYVSLSPKEILRND